MRWLKRGVLAAVAIPPLVLLAVLFRPYPNPGEVESFEREYTELPESSRQAKLESFLDRLNPDDSSEELRLAIDFDDFMIVRYASTREHAIIAAYASNYRRTTGSAAYRTCRAFESFWADDGYGKTLAQDPDGARLLEGCREGGVFGWPVRLAPDAGPRR
jgi:hypothetical protein